MKALLGRTVAVTRVPAPLPTRPDERWSMDFVRDTLADGHPFRIWTLGDDLTRESPRPAPFGRPRPQAGLVYRRERS